jgi:hypothetical protein
MRDESFDADIRFAPTSRWFDLEVAWASAPFDDFRITKSVPAMCAGSDVSVPTILAVCAIWQTASEKEQEPDVKKKDISLRRRTLLSGRAFMPAAKAVMFSFLPEPNY